MEEKSNRARRAPRFKIEVNATADLIDKAIQRDSHNCFVAEAIKMARPTATNVLVDLQSIRFTDPETRLRYLFFTPRVCQLALIHYDQGDRPEPFQFTLTKPMRITRGRGPAKILKKPLSKKSRKNVNDNENIKRPCVLFAEHADEPFAPPIEATHEVKKAMDDPYAPLGPPIAIDAAESSTEEIEVIVGGAPPPYRRRGRNPGTNIIRQRRFGAHDLIE